MKKISAFIIATLAFFSCTGEVEFSIPEAQSSYEFEAAGATQFATVSTTDFKVSCDAGWIYTEIYKGSSSHNLRITVYKNTKAAERTAEIVLTPLGAGEPATINVLQKGASPFIKILPSSVSLGMEETTLELKAVSNCGFEVETPDWINFENIEPTESEDTCKINFSIIGKVKLGESRSGNITVTSKETASVVTAVAYVEQVGAKWETAIMKWGLEDIQYIWEAFGKTTSAITTTTIKNTDFSSFPRMKEYSRGGFVYKNASGDELYAVMSADAQFKINKAGSKTSTGNINRNGENVERMQMNKATAGVGENAFMFVAPRSGILEIEAAAPNSGDRKPQIMVDGEVIDATFDIPYAIPSGVTQIPISVTKDEGVEVRFYGTNGATNYFEISYTYERPILE